MSVVASFFRWFLPDSPSPGDGFDEGICNEHVELGKSAVKWSEMAYAVTTDEEGKAKGFTFINETTYDTQAIVGKDDERMAIVVSFRGTDGLKDMFYVNLHLFQTDDPELGGEVHGGFLKAYKEAKPLVDAAVDTVRKANPDCKSLIITGHSLGAALATLYGRHALRKYPDLELNVTTFGSPRVGDLAFAKASKEAFKGRYTRWVHQNDAIPRLPPVDYEHCGRVLYLGSDGMGFSAKTVDDERGLLFAAAEWLDGFIEDGPLHRIYDHLVGEYKTRLEEFEGKHCKKIAGGEGESDKKEEAK
eukprot:TRINITY_DN3043_c5_g1_i1.p1 TRINITY_DN3043_c5_g1~~TRINITY_DN3043_c5_g1_i1.p1  ORF type:complete len:303 (+),score=56.58 TRINITY_DN3043_c5_g1_i1:53-961(+)